MVLIEINYFVYSSLYPIALEFKEDSIKKVLDLSSFTEDIKVLALALFTIFNDDKNDHTHYFEIPFKDDYGIENQSGLQASGYKN